MTVSIILPNYNHANYLQTSLSAIFSQSLAPNEVIVVDDASKDNSLEVLSNYSNSHSNLKVLKNEKNLGPIKSVNRGIEIATGDYLAFCSADDFIKPNFLEVMVNCLARNPKIAICTSDFCTFNGDDIKNLSIQPLLKKQEQRTIYPNELIYLIKKHLFWIPTNASLYRKKHLKEFGLLNEDIKWMSDWFLSYQIACKYPIAYIPMPLTGFRVVAGSYSNSRKKETITYDGLFNLLKIQPEEFQIFFKKSGVLYQQGRSVFKYLLSHPKSWNFLLRALINAIRFKLSKSGR